jgi:predicted N-acetyltransferase YhbS
MAAIDISAQPIRALGFDDIAAACALNAAVGWNQNAADWQIMLELGRGFAVDDAAGNLVATAITLPYYGGGFGWISMVLVAANHRRAGLATRLMQHCIGDLTTAGLVPVLDATPAGQPVYRALGFRSTSSMKRLSRQDGLAIDVAAAGFDIRPIEAADWPRLRVFDAMAFGADRGLLLQNLQQRQPALGLLALREGHIVGYLLGRDGRAATQLGPLVADDVDIANALLAHGLGAVSGRVYIDVADRHGDLAAWLAGLGFQVERPLTRMVYSRDASFDDAARVFVVAGPELG